MKHTLADAPRASINTLAFITLVLNNIKVPYYFKRENILIGGVEAKIVRYSKYYSINHA